MAAQQKPIQGHPPHALLDIEFLQRYSIGELLGKGSYGTVYAALDRTQNCLPVAVKVMPVEKLGPKGVENTKREVAVMSALQHPRLLRLHHAEFGSQAIALVLDQIKGGELFQHLLKLKHYSEATARTVMFHLMTGIHAMHATGYCHRDLKPDNLLMLEKPKSEQDEISDIVVGDFGFATSYTNVEPPGLTQPCGTPYYIAPDVLDVGLHKTAVSYDERVDNWSAGVIGFILLCGCPPFHADSKSKLFKAISAGNFQMERPPWNSISDEGKSFIRGLLTRDRNQRMTAAQAISHPWMAPEHPVPNIHLSESLGNLEVFEARRKLKGAIFGVDAAVRLSYLAKCGQAGIKGNTGVLDQLIASGEKIEDLDLTNNYLGKKGLEVLLTVFLDERKELHSVNLTNNLIDDHQAFEILNQIAAHGKIKKLVMDENPVSDRVGRKIVTFLQNGVLEQASVNHTRCQAHIQERVKNRSERNLKRKSEGEGGSGWSRIATSTTSAEADSERSPKDTPLSLGGVKKEAPKHSVAGITMAASLIIGAQHHRSDRYGADAPGRSLLRRMQERAARNQQKKPNSARAPSPHGQTSPQTA